MTQPRLARSLLPAVGLALLAVGGAARAQPANAAGPSGFWPFGAPAAPAVGTVTGSGSGTARVGTATGAGAYGGTGAYGTTTAGTPAATNPFAGVTIPGVGTIGPDGRIQAGGAAGAGTTTYPAPAGVGTVSGGAATGVNVGGYTIPWPGAATTGAYPGASTPASGTYSTGGLSSAEVGSGLKSALAQGLTAAVSSLGRPDGFYGTPYRIPLPGALAQTANVLRGVGLGGLVDQLDLSLNRAAEQAVPQAADVFGTALRQMTLTDAFGILRGGNTAATDYFRAKTGAELARRFRPIVSNATSQVGAARLYNQVVASAGPLGAAAGFNADLDTYVTQQATNALFAQVAQQEIAIRQNPVARTTEILRRVFGAQGR